MAIQKSIKSQFGVNAEYWRIMKLNIEVDLTRVSIVLFGWGSKDFADNGDQHLEQRQFFFAGQEFSEMAFAIANENENIYSALKRVCEAKILELEEFYGGTQL